MIFFTTLDQNHLPRDIIAIKLNVQKRNQSTEIFHVLNRALGHDPNLHLGLDQNNTIGMTVMIINGSKEDHRPENTAIN